MFDIDKVDRIVEMFILDIYVAILKIEKTSSKFDNAQDLLFSYTDWDSVIREFEIIGEASRYLLRDKKIDKIHRVVVDFRNIIIHEYFGIEPNEVWDVVYHDLDNYKNVIINLMNSIEKDLKLELIEAFIEDNLYLDFVVEKLERLR